MEAEDSPTRHEQLLEGTMQIGRVKYKHKSFCGNDSQFVCFGPESANGFVGIRQSTAFNEVKVSGVNKLEGFVGQNEGESGVSGVEGDVADFNGAELTQSNFKQIKMGGHYRCG